MATPATVKGTLVTVALGDGATSETFTAFCGINAKTINFQTNTNEEFVYDCANLESPPWRTLTKSGRFLSVSGSGLLDSSVLERYQAAYDDDDATNAKIMIDVPGASGGGFWSCGLMLTSFNITGNNGESAQVEISLESSGAVTWTDAS